MIESVTLKLDKESGIVASMKMSSFDSPSRLGGLSGKGLSLESMTGKRKVAVSCETVVHKVDAAGERPRIKTVITTLGDGGLEKILGHTVKIEVLQRELPGMEGAEEAEEEDES